MKRISNGMCTLLPVVLLSLIGHPASGKVELVENASQSTCYVRLYCSNNNVYQQDFLYADPADLDSGTMNTGVANSTGFPEGASASGDAASLLNYSFDFYPDGSVHRITASGSVNSSALGQGKCCGQFLNCSGTGIGWSQQRFVFMLKSVDEPTPYRYAFSCQSDPGNELSVNYTAFGTNQWTQGPGLYTTLTGTGTAPTDNHYLTVYSNCSRGSTGGTPQSGSAWWTLEIEYDPLVDTDGDGLYDDWEINGMDVNGDGTIDLDLPALGADPLHKDMFVEVDAGLGLNPSPVAMAMVVDAFAAAPNALMNNPDGLNGVNLHLDLAETIPLYEFANGMSDLDIVKADHFGRPSERSDANWPNIRQAKEEVYRYCIFGYSHSGGSSSGLGEWPGNDFLVTLGAWTPSGGTIDQQAGTFMHELGHNLGLGHGGDQVDPQRDWRYNYKPNYHSIMNYLWQFPQSPYEPSWVLDYSRAIFPTLEEYMLSELNGIGGHPGHHVPVGPPFLGGLYVVDEYGPVDWNQDGNVVDDFVGADVNRIYPDMNHDGIVDAQDETVGDILTGYEDWSKLQYRIGGHPNYEDGVHMMDWNPPDMTFEQFLDHGGYAPGDTDGNRRTDMDDLAILAAYWQNDACGACGGADFTKDGRVLLDDLTVLFDHWLHPPVSTPTTPKADIPVFEPAGGWYEFPVEVVITSATPNAVIHYTTDGSEPTQDSPSITSGGSILIENTATLRARSWTPDIDPSLVRASYYQVGEWIGG